MAADGRPFSVLCSLKPTNNCTVCEFLSDAHFCHLVWQNCASDAYGISSHSIFARKLRARGGACAVFDHVEACVRCRPAPGIKIEYYLTASRVSRGTGVFLQRNLSPGMILGLVLLSVGCRPRVVLGQATD